MTKTLLIAAAMLASSAAIAEPTRVPVSYAGLDLASPRGQALLDRRIAQAARRICRPDVSADLAAQLAARRCMRETVANTQPQVKRAIALAQSGTRLAAR